MVEGNCCWKMLENEGSNATEDPFFPGQTDRKPSINKITSIKSYKCNVSEDKVAENSFMYGGINYHNSFTGNVVHSYIIYLHNTQGRTKWRNCRLKFKNPDCR